MAETISENPEQTSGRANKGISSYSYPLNEILSSSTRLKFIKYDRFSPNDEAQESTTAIINLPLPVTIPDNHSFDVGQHQLGNYGNINSNNWNDLKKIGSSIGSTNMDELTKLGQAAATEAIKSRQFNVSGALAGLALTMGSSTDMVTAAQSFAGVVKNPHATIIFNGVALRPISLEWRLSARTEQESQTLLNIYNTIKLRSHPEELANGVALNYPDLVYIEFNGKIKKYAPVYQRAFITNINLTPDSSGGMSLYKSGAPTGYTFQISATEISIITRNSLQQQIDGTS